MSNISKTLKNAVLIKEVQTKSKRIGLSVCILIINIVLALIAVTIMTVLNGNIVSNNSIDDGNAFITFFIAVVIAEAVMLFFITPALSAGAIASEKERQTLDVLLTTNMTPWQIVWGKYWSSIANVLVIIISTLPYLSTVFLFGGVSFFTVIGILLALIGCVMYLGTFGVLMSTMIKKTNAASVICYIVLLAITFGTISAVATILSLTEALNEMVWYFNPNMSGTKLFYGDWSFILLLFSPITIAFDLFSKAFGITIIWSNIDTGMGYFIDSITDGRLSETCFISRFWSVEALAVQLFTGYWVLRLAAACLNPVKKPKKKAKTVNTGKKIEK